MICRGKHGLTGALAAASLWLATTISGAQPLAAPAPAPAPRVTPPPAALPSPPPAALAPQPSSAPSNHATDALPPPPPVVAPWPENEPSAVVPVREEALHAALSSWGCQASDILEIGGRWYAACGAGGVYIVERRGADNLVLSGRRQGQGEARSLFMRGGSLWVELVQLEARPLADLPPSAGTTSVEPALSTPRSYATTTPTLVAASTTAEAPAHESLVAPERVGGVLRVEGALRPFLPIEKLGFAALLDLTVTFHGERAWYVEARAFPLGGLVGRGRNVGLGGLYGSAGYDNQYFSVGLGVGLLRHGESEYYDDTRFESPSFGSSGGYRVNDRVGFVVTQSARLGALDGLHLRVHNAFVLDDERWQFAFVDVSLQIPLNARTALISGGSGGQQGAFFVGEIGLRRRVFGTGASGTLFLRPSVGVAGVDTRVSPVSLGPMVGLHAEWRQ